MIAQMTTWWLAFWIALACLPEPRFAAALASGALMARLGWGLLHIDRLWLAPGALFDTSGGFSVLFVPLGLLLVAAYAGPLRSRLLSEGVRALVVGLGVARAGCIAAGCCVGMTAGSAWPIAESLGGRHPVAIYELVGLVILGLALRGMASHRVAPAFALGFGMLRLVLEPLRALPPLGPPLIEPAWVAGLWVCSGVAWWACASRRGDPSACSREAQESRARSPEASAADPWDRACDP